MTMFDQMRAWRDAAAQEEAEGGAEMFLGKPDRWYEPAHYGCTNGHVSRCILTGDAGDRCLACLAAVILIPPMTEPEFADVLAGL